MESINQNDVAVSSLASKNSLASGFECFCHFLFRFYCPTTVSLTAEWPSEPLLICSNHNSHMDTPVLMYASRVPFSQFAMLAAKDYFFDTGGVGAIFRRFMHLIPIDRRASMASIRETIRACQSFSAGALSRLIIYPEGTRSSDSCLQEFKKGAAYIALKLGVPIVPAYIHGTHSAQPKGRVVIRPTRLHVSFGAPIYPQQIDFLSQLPLTQRAEQLTIVLHKTITKLSEAYDV